MDLPITNAEAKKVAAWLREHYGDHLKDSVSGTVLKPDHLIAIICQETAYFWVSMLDRLSPDEILARCVLDASGDFPGTIRSAFPRNTETFRSKYGGVLTDMLINEANKTRALRGYSPKQWVYKGYGIFQNDLQNITGDESFFRGRLWYNMQDCLAGAMRELKGKLSVSNGDIWRAIKAYNGSGSAAEKYANNVQVFYRVITQN